MLDWQRLVFTWRWEMSAGDPPSGAFKDSSPLWMHGQPPDVDDFVLTQWKVYQRFHSPEPLEVPAEFFSRFELGGGAASGETADSYPLIGWTLGAATPFWTPERASALYGRGRNWEELTVLDDVVTLADHPGCDACIPIPCDEMATVRMLTRAAGPFVGRLDTVCTVWLRPRTAKERAPCS